MVDENGNIFSSKDNVCMALLEDGQIVSYDGCSNDYDIEFYNPNKWKFLGKGVIYSIGGARQSLNDHRFFFVRNGGEK